MGLFNKKELTRIQELEVKLQQANLIIEKNGTKNFLEIQDEIKKEKENLASLKKQEENYEIEIDSLKTKKSELEKMIFDLEDDISMQDFGLYTPIYNCMNSEEYANKIKETRNIQKQMIKNKTALSFFDGWTLDGSKSKGTAMNNDNMKMVLRAFNYECDAIINKVKFNNIEKIEQQIRKSAEAINKLNARNRITIKPRYISSKIEELHLVHEYALKKQEEKEAIRAAREEEREQAKLKKEIEEARKTIYKEQAHYENAKEKLLFQLANAADEDKQEIEAKIKELDEKLIEIQKNIEDIDYREANQRAGYVYVISNIGSFGENIYKIGMTRRLEPQDRVDELGDASVPFAFDVHAMIFSDDAPKLESALHHAFESKKVNMVNGRKEFFNVTLEEIEKVIHENHDKLIEIKKFPDAEQYRETLMLKQRTK